MRKLKKKLMLKEGMQLREGGKESGYDGILTFFFFFFFVLYDYCFRVQNPTCSLRYGIEKTPNYPWEKANPSSPSGAEPNAHLAPNKKPLTS